VKAHLTDEVRVPKSHMTQDDRITIEIRLGEGCSIGSIGKELGRPTSTISREIKKHTEVCKDGAYGRVHNACIHRRDCDLTGQCPNNPNCTKKKNCRKCELCNSVCSYFQEETCPRLSLAPYVCNGCENKRKCTLTKLFYRAKNAQADYEKLWSESRSGVNLTEEELLALDELISPRAKKGQSLHHIVVTSNGDIPVCERTLYTYARGGLFTFGPIDMPRAVRMKPRKGRNIVVHKVDPQCRIGRTYEDFLIFCSEREGSPLPLAELDTVIGRVGGKCIMTIQMVPFGFMLAFLRDHNTAASAISSFDSLYELLGRELFSKMFPLFLTDCGSEFSNPERIEKDADGVVRTKLFYCHPNSPFEKGHCENNHANFRRIAPKGTSFDNLEQKHINLAFSHVNSFVRGALYDLAPMTLFANAFGWDVVEKLGMSLIPPEDVNLTPNLWKKALKGE